MELRGMSPELESCNREMALSAKLYMRDLLII
jgi:hypothetical protein